MKEFKLLIMNNDSFLNEEILLRTLVIMQETVLKDRSISFVNAMLPGADALAYMLAKRQSIPVFNLFTANAVDKLQNFVFQVESTFLTNQGT